MSILPLLLTSPQNKGGSGKGGGGKGNPGYPSTTGNPSGGDRTNGPRK